MLGVDAKWLHEVAEQIDPEDGFVWNYDPGGTDPCRTAIEAEADRLAGIYFRITRLARKRRLDLPEAG